MAKERQETKALRAGNIHEPESIVRDDFSKPTFAEREMKLQGTKSYEYNARKYLEKKKEKTPYYETLGHSFFWLKNIHMPILRHTKQKPKLTGKSNKKDHSVITVIITVLAVLVVMYFASNWDGSLKHLFVFRTEGSQEIYVTPHERADNNYETGPDCVSAFMTYALEGDAANSLRCLDSYAGNTYFRCQNEAFELAESEGVEEYEYSKYLLMELAHAYGDEDFDYSQEILDYSYSAAPSLTDGRHIVTVKLELETENGSETIKLKIPTVTKGGHYYISYEIIR